MNKKYITIDYEEYMEDYEKYMELLKEIKELKREINNFQLCLCMKHNNSIPGITRNILYIKEDKLKDIYGAHEIYLEKGDSNE